MERYIAKGYMRISSDKGSQIENNLEDLDQWGGGASDLQTKTQKILKRGPTISFLPVALFKVAQKQGGGKLCYQLS